MRRKVPKIAIKARSRTKGISFRDISIVHVVLWLYIIYGAFRLIFYWGTFLQANWFDRTAMFLAVLAVAALFVITIFVVIFALVHFFAWLDDFFKRS